MMNVLWIQADQMRADCAGFMGHPLVQTPNLDALASRGMVFGNAFAQSPICTPSRTCLFTGRYVHAHGAWWNGVPMSGERSLLPEILRQAGYHTGLIGKLHFNPQDRSYGFNHRELHEERLPTELSAYDRFLEAQLKLGGTRETDLFAGHGSAPYTEWSHRAASVGLCKLPEHVEETRWCADRACAFLREQTDSPFFLYASFIRPHSPYNPLPDFAALYEDADISPPPFSREEWDLAPPRIRATARSWGWDKLGPEDFSEVRRHYYALCSQADHNVGRILQALDAQGLADSTLVVFASDHGDFLGEHGLLYKEHLWDGALHVPLIIYDPRRKDNALIYSGLVETIDVMPTLLALLGLPASTEIQGKSLTPIMENPDQVHRDAVFAEFASYSVNKGVHDILRVSKHPDIVSIRTDRWKYIHYVDEDGELYDIREDPGEQRNLFRDPDVRPVREALTSRLLNWRIASGDRTEPQRENSYFGSLLGTR